MLKTTEQSSYKQCEGYMVQLPSHIFPFIEYPAGLHLLNALPWLPGFGRNCIVFRSTACIKTVRKKHACDACQTLRENTALKGIIRRMAQGVKERSNYAYHGIGDLLEILKRKDTQIRYLRTRALTQAKTILAVSELVSRGVGEMFYLFQGSSLVGMAASMLGQLLSKDVKELTPISASECFPYRESNGTLYYLCSHNVRLTFSPFR